MEINKFKTDTATIANDLGDNLLLPFSPPIFQSQVHPKFVEDLLKEGKNLTIEEDDWRDSLAGNMKYGGSYKYKGDFLKKSEKYLNNYLTRFFNHIKSSFSENFFEKQVKKGEYKLDKMWINFQHKHDFNPPHTHTGEFSFVIFCKVPEKIFKEQAISNTKEAGNIIFMHGTDSISLCGSHYTITPYENLILIFPAKLTHYVPPFWADAERISVSGNFVVV